MRHLAGEVFSDSACAGRLPRTITQAQRQLVDDARRELSLGESHRWHGHRVAVIDGSSDSMPDTPPLRKHYGVSSLCPATGLGFPTSHLLLLMDHASGLFIDCIDSPLSTSDLSQTQKLHTHLSAGDVLLGDIAFAGWAHLALLIQAKLHAVVPPHHRRIVDFTPDRTHAHPRKGKSAKRAGKPRPA